MTIAFDTNVLIEIDKGNEKLLDFLEDLKKKEPSDPVMPFPIFSEFYYGYLKEGKQKIALKTLSGYEMVHSTENSAKVFAEIKYDLEKKGKPMNLLDILIASLCIDNGITLVTLDDSFDEIKELDKIVLMY